MWSSKGILERLGVTEDVWVPIEKIMREGFKKGFPAGKIYENAASMLNKELIDAWSLAGDVETVNMQMVFADKAIGR
jgi:hypothetical protein